MSIASELSTLAANKAAIKAAIEAMNAAIPPTDSLAQWPTSIASIPTGSQLPYDEVVDYLSIPGGQNITIDTGYTSPYFLCSMWLRLPTNMDSSSNRFVFGNWGSSASDSTQIYSTSSTKLGFFNCHTYGVDVTPTSGIGSWGQFTICNNKMMNDLVYSDQGGFSTTALSTARNLSIGYIGSCDFDIRSFIFSNSEKTICCIPVRVGQAGALYDTISGTLYENTGSGTITPVPFAS